MTDEARELAPVIPLFGGRNTAGSPAVPDEDEPGPRSRSLRAVPAADPSPPVSRFGQFDERSGAGHDAGDDDSSAADDDEDREDGTPVSAGPTKDIRSVSQLALGRRGLSVSELTSRLTSLGYPEDAVLDELLRLRDLDYLNDRRLAEDVVRVESERKGKGRQGIQSELRRRGIAEADYLDALETLERDGERGRARELAEKRIRQLGGLDDVAVRRRLHSYLARRGFAGDTVSAAVDAAMHPHR